MTDISPICLPDLETPSTGKYKYSSGFFLSPEASPEVPMSTDKNYSLGVEKSLLKG